MTGLRSSKVTAHAQEKEEAGGGLTRQGLRKSNESMGVPGGEDRPPPRNTGQMAPGLGSTRGAGVCVTAPRLR